MSQICRYGIFSNGLKNEFETAVGNEPQCPSHCSCTVVWLTFLAVFGLPYFRRWGCNRFHLLNNVSVVKFCKNFITVNIVSN